jgi:hypothetical protein
VYDLISIEDHSPSIFERDLIFDHDTSTAALLNAGDHGGHAALFAEFFDSDRI